MANINDKRLTVLFNSTDLSTLAAKMGEEETSLTISNFSTDALYIGYKKPIKNIFFEVSQALTSGVSKSVSIWDGSAWVAISAVDDTKNFNKSDLLYLDGDQVLNNKEKNINGKTLFWVRVSFSANGSVKFKGINTLFCSESDLKNEEPSMAKMYPREIQSHIFSLVAAREFILRRINNSDGWYKTEDGYISCQDFTQFDIFNIDELRDAAVFYTLHRIFDNRSNEADDFYSQKSEKYLNRFNDEFKLWHGRKLTLDRNDDGIVDKEEKIASIQQGEFIK